VAPPMNPVCVVFPSFTSSLHRSPTPLVVNPPPSVAVRILGAVMRLIAGLRLPMRFSM